MAKCHHLINRSKLAFKGSLVWKGYLAWQGCGCVLCANVTRLAPERACRCCSGSVLWLKGCVLCAKLAPKWRSITATRLFLSFCVLSATALASCWTTRQRDCVLWALQIVVIANRIQLPYISLKVKKTRNISRNEWKTDLIQRLTQLAQSTQPQQFAVTAVLRSLFGTLWQTERKQSSATSLLKIWAKPWITLWKTLSSHLCWLGAPSGQKGYEHHHLLFDPATAWDVKVSKRRCF